MTHLSTTKRPSVITVTFALQGRYRYLHFIMIMQKLIYYSGVGDVAKKALQEAKKKLCHSQTSLGQGYSHFILGLEHWRSHHSKGGRYILDQLPDTSYRILCYNACRSRASNTHADQMFYEVSVHNSYNRELVHCCSYSDTL